jgi:hypothetical protein
MLRSIFILVAGISFCTEVPAQLTETITVKAGNDLSDALATHGVYQFPVFNTGTVLFRDGSSTKARMNFNVYLNAMQFIDDKGDTLEIANPELIDSIKLDSTVYFYTKEYLQVVSDGADIKLVRQQKVSFQSVKRGAYGLPAPGASIETYGGNAVKGFNTVNRLTLNEDIIVKRETYYFIYYKKFRSVRANRPGFHTAFPGLKDQVNNFTSTNKIDFKKEDDLKKLFQFCIKPS